MEKYRVPNLVSSNRPHRLYESEYDEKSSTNDRNNFPRCVEIFLFQICLPFVPRLFVVLVELLCKSSIIESLCKRKYLCQGC